MDRRGLVLLIWIGACTGSPLPSGDDELGEGTSTSASSTGSETDGTSTETDTSASTTSTEADTSSTQADTSSDDTTTGTACTTPEVVTFLMIDADTPAEGLYCLREVEQSLQIEDVDWIDLSYLPALEQVGGLWIYDVDSMTSLSGSSLSEIGTLTLTGMPALTSTAGLEQLVGLESLYVGGLPMLAKVELPVGLPTERIDAYNAIHLESLAGLDSLASIGALELRYLFELNSLEGLPLGAMVDTLELRNLTTLTQAQADAFASAVQAQSSTICGLEGDEFCYLSRAEAAPCPQ